MTREDDLYENLFLNFDHLECFGTKTKIDWGKINI